MQGAKRAAEPLVAPVNVSTEVAEVVSGLRSSDPETVCLAARKLKLQAAPQLGRHLLPFALQLGAELLRVLQQPASPAVAAEVWQSAEALLTCCGPTTALSEGLAALLVAGGAAGAARAALAAVGSAAAMNGLRAAPPRLILQVCTVAHCVVEGYLAGSTAEEEAAAAMRLLGVAAGARHGGTLCPFLPHALACAERAARSASAELREAACAAAATLRRRAHNPRPCPVALDAAAVVAAAVGMGRMYGAAAPTAAAAPDLLPPPDAPDPKRPRTDPGPEGGAAAAASAAPNGGGPAGAPAAAGAGAPPGSGVGDAPSALRLERTPDGDDSVATTVPDHGSDRASESGDDEVSSDAGLVAASAPMEPASVKGVSCGGTVVWARAHMQGSRSNMEDAFRICTLNKPGLPQRVFLGVFDGHGDRGVVARAAAHRLAATVADHEQYRDGDVAGALFEAVRGTDEWLRSADLSPWMSARDPPSQVITAERAGSCVACAVVEPQKGFVWTAHLGDSKVVVFDKDFQVVFATTDHKPGSDSEQRRIEGLGGTVVQLYGVSRVSSERSNVQLAVSRALGDHGLRPYVSADCHLSAVGLPEGGGWVLLACDGVWDAPRSPKAAGAFLKEEIRKAGGDTAGGEAMRAALRALCTQSAASMDNVTCVLARLPRGTSSPAPAGPAIARQQQQEQEERRKAEEERDAAPLPGFAPSGTSL